MLKTNFLKKEKQKKSLKGKIIKKENVGKKK